jgi:pimeloyl-ACP methyl ester carboxylesterase
MKTLPTKATRVLLCFAGFLLAPPAALAFLMATRLPLSASGWTYLAAYAILVASLIAAPCLPKIFPRMFVAGLSVILLTFLARTITAATNTSAQIHMLTLPRGSESRRSFSVLLDEQDGLILGEALFHLAGGASADEHRGISEALHTDYTALKNEQAIFPSPVLDTYLGLQHLKAFDAVMIQPQENLRPDVAVIFLHGFMGNVTAQCWEIAQAVETVGARTVCPSANWRGEWWLPEGQAILHETFDYLRVQGVRTFYLGGFSNGGFGISRITDSVSAEAGLAGLFFIDGIGDGAGIQATGLPVLIIQGSRDTRMPAALARETAHSIGASAAYVEIDSDHFVIMKEPLQVQAALAEWLEAH